VFVQLLSKSHCKRWVSPILAGAKARGICVVDVRDEVTALFAADAVFVADGGDFVATASYIVRPRGPRGWLDPGPFGTLGVGAGFALGAALSRPHAEVWILFGYGACGYSLAEFDTFVRHGIQIIAV
jgi:thiamine pyrophosphate-dependent acetolactate synthase large subunit-like protein